MNLHFLLILLVLCFPANGLEDTYSATSYSEDEEAPVFPLSNSQGFYDKKSSYNKTYNYNRHSYGDAKSGYGTYNGGQQHNSKPSYGGSYAAEKPDYSAPNPSYKSHQSYGGVKPSYGGSYAAQKPDYSAPKPSYKSHQSYDGDNRDTNKKRYGTGHYNYAGGHDSYSGEQNKNDYSGQKPGYNYEHEYGQGVKYSSHSNEHYSGENEEYGSEDDKQPKDYDGEKPNHGPAYPVQQQPVIRNQPYNPAGLVPPPIYPLYGMPPYTNYYPLYYFPTPEQQEKINEILTGRAFLKVKPEEATTTQSSTTKMGTQKLIQLPTTQETSTSTASPTQVTTNSLASSTPTLSSTLATVARLEETTTTQTQSSTTKKTSTSTATPTQVTESTNPTTTISTDDGTSTTPIITSALIKASSGNSSFNDSAALANGLAFSTAATVSPPVQTFASKSELPAKRASEPADGGFAPAIEDNSLPVTILEAIRLETVQYQLLRPILCQLLREIQCQQQTLLCRLVEAILSCLLVIILCQLKMNLCQPQLPINFQLLVTVQCPILQPTQCQCQPLLKAINFHLPVPIQCQLLEAILYQLLVEIQLLEAIQCQLLVLIQYHLLELILRKVSKVNPCQLVETAMLLQLLATMKRGSPSNHSSSLDN
uniref:Uncharacterized protein n=1 Tax=Globodera rostochiensis TaxID=31243 RepID=A0A914H8S0_GLORO